MEVHRQTCQNCGSTTLHNLIVRQLGKASTVHVKCARCGELVASYRLNAYYHHGKSLDSWLHSIGSDASDSARRQLNDFQRIQAESLEGFRQAEEELRLTGRQFATGSSSEGKESPGNPENL